MLVVHWHKPAAGFIKLHTDAVTKESGECGTGFVARDAIGIVMLVGAHRLHSTKNVESTEVEAALWGI